MFTTWLPSAADLSSAAETTVVRMLKIRPEEQVLIITNPVEDVAEISFALHDAVLHAGGKPVVLFQPVKSQIDFAEPAVLKAIATEPQVLMSISAEKIGKDPHGLKKPYEYEGKTFEHILDLLLDGKKSMRALWSPTITKEIFSTTVIIDYDLLKKNSLLLKDLFDRAEELKIVSPGGTDLTIGVRGREGMVDNGDYSVPGEGGNLPAGETFISPELNTAEGVIVFDGSISAHEGEILINTPIRVDVEAGFLTAVSGGKEAEELNKTLQISRELALKFEQEGKLKQGMGEVYARNAGNIGELGIGLNPNARVVGNMLVDEKAYRTCHIALGSNYDDDAPAMTHLDGLIHKPTISALHPDGTEKVFFQDGELLLE